MKWRRFISSNEIESNFNRYYIQNKRDPTSLDELHPSSSYHPQAIFFILLRLFILAARDIINRGFRDGITFPRYRFRLRARILRAKLKHNISASTRNSISRGPPWNSYIGRPRSPSNIPPPAHPSSFHLLAAPVWQMFNITWKFWVVPTILVRGCAFECHVYTFVNTNVRPPRGKGHEPWKGWCVCVCVFDRAISKLRGWIFSGHTSPVTWDFRTTDLKLVFFRTFSRPRSI